VRAAQIDDLVDTLNRPATIAANLLPFMAWQFSVDR
jgi:P2-related tail formation protein